MLPIINLRRLERRSASRILLGADGPLAPPLHEEIACPAAVYAGWPHIVLFVNHLGKQGQAVPFEVRLTKQVEIARPLVETPLVVHTTSLQSLHPPTVVVFNHRCQHSLGGGESGDGV